MATEVNKLEGLFVGDFGDAITITLVDDDNVAVDVSAYTGTITVTAISPDELKIVSWTGTFSTDGSDGIITFTPASGDIDREGDWKAQVKLTISTTNVAKSYIFTLSVGRGITS